MEPTESMTLLQAVGIYASSGKAGDNDEELHRELYKFVNWCGPDRAFAEISAPAIGEYADQVAGTGTTPSLTRSSVSSPETPPAGLGKKDPRYRRGADPC